MHALNNPHRNHTSPLPRPNKRSLWRFSFLFSAVALGCFALSPTAQAVLPPPDGGYPNQNTAEGEDALFTLTTGINNTANGYRALHENTTGDFNTANGYRALYSNTTGGGNTATGESRSEEHTSELQSLRHLVCRLLLEKKKK